MLVIGVVGGAACGIGGVAAGLEGVACCCVDGGFALDLLDSYLQLFSIFSSCKLNSFPLLNSLNSFLIRSVKL